MRDKTTENLQQSINFLTSKIKKLGKLTDKKTKFQEKYYSVSCYGRRKQEQKIYRNLKGKQNL